MQKMVDITEIVKGNDNRIRIDQCYGEMTSEGIVVAVGVIHFGISDQKFSAVVKLGFKNTAPALKVSEWITRSVGENKSEIFPRQIDAIFNEEGFIVDLEEVLE